MLDTLACVDTVDQGVCQTHSEVLATFTCLHFTLARLILQNLNNGTIDSTTARNGPFFTSNEQVGFFEDQCFQSKIFCVFHSNLTLRPFFGKHHDASNETGNGGPDVAHEPSV